MCRIFSILFVLLFASNAFSQIEAPKEVDPYEPIIVSYVIPVKGDTEAQVSWRTSSDSVKYESVPNTNILHIWAPPGDHWIEATIAIQQYREQLVLVPDPAAPTDFTKAKAEKVRIAVSFSVNRHTANFKVKGAKPTPVPAPVPNVNVPTAEMQTLMAPVKSVMAKADPNKAAIWASIWADYLYSVKTVSPLKTSTEFKTATKAFMNAAAAKSGLEGAFPGFTDAMDAAHSSRFGSEEGPLDWNKAIEFVAATVWACTP